ncbi:lamin-B3-like isoform X2 [Narcine bancroftii]
MRGFGKWTGDVVSRGADCGSCSVLGAVQGLQREHEVASSVRMTPFTSPIRLKRLREKEELNDRLATCIERNRWQERGRRRERSSARRRLKDELGATTSERNRLKVELNGVCEENRKLIER